MIDTYIAHILPFVAAPVSVFLLKQFIDQVPNELLDAARIDGANEWAIVFRVIMPICRPAVSTVALLTFQMVWNNMEPSIYFIENEALRTLPFFLGTLTSGLPITAGQMRSSSQFIGVCTEPNLLPVPTEQVIQTWPIPGLNEDCMRKALCQGAHYRYAAPNGLWPGTAQHLTPAIVLMRGAGECFACTV